MKYRIKIITTHIPTGKVSSETKGYQFLGTAYRHFNSAVFHRNGHQIKNGAVAVIKNHLYIETLLLQKYTEDGWQTVENHELLEGN